MSSMQLKYCIDAPSNVRYNELINYRRRYGRPWHPPPRRRLSPNGRLCTPNRRRLHLKMWGQLCPWWPWSALSRSCQFLFSDVAASFVFVFFPNIIVVLFFLVTAKFSSSFILLLAVIFHHLVSSSFVVVLFIDYCDIFTLFLVPHITKVSTCLCGRSESNTGPLAWQSDALTTHL